ncbi:hypothetical protein GCM10022279_20060 [Comamonas faecalis]|uniref:Uncharacterized protein n=1 Tax=Comamonas faecalis TaxID=1387849 RepID=A0ABP7REL9_9BURK
MVFLGGKTLYIASVGIRPLRAAEGLKRESGANPELPRSGKWNATGLKNVLRHPRASVAVQIGMGCKALFLPIAAAIGKKSNAADRPRLRCHRPQGVMRDILSTGCQHPGSEVQ